MNIIMARAYCHKIIKLSPVIQSLAPEKEVVCNVHGVREKFLHVGDEYRHQVRGREEAIVASVYLRLIQMHSVSLLSGALVSRGGSVANVMRWSTHVCQMPRRPPLAFADIIFYRLLPIL